MRRILPVLLLLGGCAGDLRINQLQFVGSHNSYKQPMSAEHMQALAAVNPNAAASLAYAHPPLTDQLDLGVRKLELDVFYDRAGRQLVVGHVQQIDMNSHCATLEVCLQQVRAWSDAHPDHVPIWISFNAKDQTIDGLPVPDRFDAEAFALFDEVLEAGLGDRLIRPSDIRNLVWPTVAGARGRFLLILDEQGDKRDLYLRTWRERPMFANAPEGHAAAAVMIVNDPLAEGARIRRLVEAGYLVRTRADADTLEARRDDPRRREAAFASGAQAISTDYYEPDNPFGTAYWVRPVVRCNPRTAPARCRFEE